RSRPWRPPCVHSGAISPGGPAMHSIRVLLVVLACVGACQGAAPPLRDPLPEGAIARLGLARMVAGPDDGLAVSHDGNYVYAAWSHYGEESSLPVKWFRLSDGRDVPPMDNVPKGYTLRHAFPDGKRLVGTKGMFLLFADARAKEPLARIPTGG